MMVGGVERWRVLGLLVGDGVDLAVLLHLDALLLRCPTARPP